MAVSAGSVMLVLLMVAFSCALPFGLPPLAMIPGLAIGPDPMLDAVALIEGAVDGKVCPLFVCGGDEDGW